MRLGQSRGKHVLAALGALVGGRHLGRHRRRPGSDTGLVGQWSFDELGGQSALDAGPYGLDGRLGATAEPDPADPARVGGALGRRAPVRGRLGRPPARRAGARRGDAHGRGGRARRVESRPLPLRGVARQPRLRRRVLRPVHRIRGRDGDLRVRRLALRRLADRPRRPTCGTAHGITSPDVRRPGAAAVRRRAPRRRAARVAAADRLLDDHVERRLRPLRGRLRPVVPRGSRPGAALVGAAQPAGGRRRGAARPASRARLPPLSDVTPLPAAAPAAVLPAGPAAGTPPPAAPGAPARACALRSRARASRSAAAPPCACG